VAVKNVAAMAHPVPKIYQLKISLKHIRPVIWRSFQVRADTSLTTLHEIIQRVMGWENYHLFYFDICGVEYTDPAFIDDELEMLDADRFTVAFALPRVRNRCGYVYDFGDHWEHTLELEKKLDPEPGERYPLCIDGQRSCPPEDCGGIGGYANLLSILKNPRHEYYEQMRTWAGPRFNPERFNCGIVNKRLPRRVVVRAPK
jgi:hypothetical protein